MLSHWFGIHPRDARTHPEDGGLTWGQLRAYLEAAADLPPPGGVFWYSNKG